MIDSRALRQEVAKRRSSFVESDFGEIPSGIPYLVMLLEQTSSLEDKHLYFALILGECVRAGNREAELHYLRQQAELQPQQPIFLASLGAALARESGSENEALARCSEAVTLARIEDRQVRYCLTWQARVALVLASSICVGAKMGEWLLRPMAAKAL